jgi:ligand-binding sensor domain-containing protein
LAIRSSSVRTARWLRPALAYLAMALAGERAHAQTPRYAVANWNTEDGLPSNVTLKVRQTSDGYLWLASYEGLVRFDGESFRNFTEIDVPGLKRPSFWRIAADSLGGLWAASETSGLVHFADWRWRLYRAADGLKSDKVTAVYVDGSVVWVGTRSGVNRVVGGSVQSLPAPVGMEEPFVIDMARDGEGNLWIVTAAEGLLRYRDGVYTRLDSSNGLPDDRGIVVYRDRDGAVWVGTYGSGVSRIHQGRLTHHATTGPHVPRRVNDVLRTSDGTLWLAADNGLFHLVNDQAVPVLLPDGRVLFQASGLYADGDGNIWVGARQGGLYRFRPSRVSPLTVSDGLPHQLVSVIEGDGADGAWIGGQGGVVHWTPRGTRELLTQGNGRLGDDIVRDLLRARDGTVWMATNGGLTRLRGGESTILTTADGLPDVRVRALAEDSVGGLWAGTYRGLAYLRDGRIRAYREADGLRDLFVLSVFIDRRGTLWVGTQSEGLFRLQDGRFVPGPPELAGQPIFRISESRDGTLWVGSGLGLARVREGRVAFFTTRQGLPATQCSRRWRTRAATSG